jgi:hypothetical protein
MEKEMTLFSRLVRGDWKKSKYLDQNFKGSLSFKNSCRLNVPKAQKWDRGRERLPNI